MHDYIYLGSFVAERSSTKYLERATERDIVAMETSPGEIAEAEEFYGRVAT